MNAVSPIVAGLVAVNRTNHDVLAVRAGHCETGPALRQSQSTPSFCFLGKKPERPIAITWNDASAGAQHTSTVPLPPLWPEDPRPEDDGRLPVRVVAQ